MDPEQVLAEGGEALIAGWLSATLTAGLRLPEDESEERRDFLLAGAKAALNELAPAGAWLGERIQAVQFLCAHSAAMDWQAAANSAFLGEPVRHRAQRFATQMLSLTSRQLATLARLKDQRRREAEAAARQAWRQEAHATRQQLARGSAVTAELERMMKQGGGTKVMAEDKAGPAPLPRPVAAGAAVPEPPPGSAPALSRQQRRALERLRRKEARR